MYKKIALTLFAFSIIYVSVPSSSYGIRRNISDSLPTKFFLSGPIRKIERGQYVELKHKETEGLLAKQIIGLPGDLISVRKEEFFINGKKIDKLLKYSSLGLLLVPIGEGMIPEDYYFVYASHKKSFDSRYQRFGLVHRNQLEETLWPLF